MCVGVCAYVYVCACATILCPYMYVYKYMYIYVYTYIHIYTYKLMYRSTIVCKSQTQGYFQCRTPQNNIVTFLPHFFRFRSASSLSESSSAIWSSSICRFIDLTAFLAVTICAIIISNVFCKDSMIFSFNSSVLSRKKKKQRELAKAQERAHMRAFSKCVCMCMRADVCVCMCFCACVCVL